MGQRDIEVLKTNTNYSFYVRAKNVVGKWGALSAPASITTARDTTAPSTANPSLQTLTPNFFLLRWTLPTDKDIEEIRILVFTSNTPASAKIIKRVSGNTTKAFVNLGETTEDASITIGTGTTYYFWLAFVDTSGNVSSLSTTPASGSLSTSGTGMSHGALSGLANDDHPQYIRHNLSTASNDFLVGSGSNTFVKKTLTETRNILGIILSTTTGVNGLATGVTNLYTVPSGVSAIVTEAIVRVTEAVNVTSGPTLGIGIGSGEDDIISPTSLSSLTSMTNFFKLNVSGLTRRGAPGDVIKLGIDTAGSGTTLTLAVDLLGYLI